MTSAMIVIERTRNPLANRPAATELNAIAAMTAARNTDGSPRVTIANRASKSTPKKI
ncbi:unannotated protein [freshwater metagenome]|uniref:Unannotated protein n=1 Tax=freshwater metagenome TaxID=449393 RepID=A0A6J7UST6_9ZZZZ